jgi:hypothetical protein
MAGAFVRVLFAGQQASSASYANVLTASMAAGNFALIGVDTANARTMGATTDSRGGNTYQIDVDDGSGSNGTHVISTKPANALLSGDTVTVPITGGSSSGAVIIVEVTGLDGTTWFDKAATVIGAAATSGGTAATAALAQADNFIWGLWAGASTSGTFTPSAGESWTTDTVTTGTRELRDFYKNVISTTGVAFNAAWVNSVAFGMAVAVYKSAAAAASPGFYVPVRIANRNVGPMALRRRFRQPYLPQPPPQTFAPAELASGTGAASQPAVNIQPAGGLASGTGAAGAPTASVKPAGGLASGTGVAQAPSPDVKVNAGLASGTGTAYQPTTVSGISVNAGLASGTGTAYQPSASVKPAGGLASGTGTAYAPKPDIKAYPTVAAGTGAAYDAAPSTATPITLYVATADQSTDYIDFLRAGSLRIKTNADRRNGTMDLELVGVPANFYNGGRVTNITVESIIQFKWGNDILFCGAIRSVHPTDIGNPGNIALTLGCQDLTFLAADVIIDPTVASGIRTTVESDAARISWLFTTFFVSDFAAVDSATDVDTFVLTMPDQDFTGMTLAAAMDEIAKVTGADWWLDFGSTSGASGFTPNPNLHYTSDVATKDLTTPYGAAATDLFTSTAHGLVANRKIRFATLTGGAGLVIGTTYYVIASGLTANAFKVSATQGGAAFDFTTNVTVGSYALVADPAPFGLSDVPDNVTTYGYAGLVIPQEATELRNRVVIIGGNGYKVALSDTVSIALYGATRTGVIKDSSITDAVHAQDVADAYFLANAYHRVAGSLTCYHTGLVPGVDVVLTSAGQQMGQFGAAVGSVTYRVTTVETNYPKRGVVSYRISFGSVPRLLQHAIRDVAHAVTPAEAAQIAADEVANFGVTAFPANPGTNTRAYRQDLDLWFVWNGTRWLSVETFVQSHSLLTTTMPLSATPPDAFFGPTFVTPGSDLWLVTHVTQFFVSGGTALSGSHKWAATFSKRPTNNIAETIVSVTINSGAKDVWRTDTQAINALVGSGYFVFSTAWVKTGTPGDLYALEYWTYRIVAT